MVSLTALALLALPLAVTASSAGAPHYSHPRRNNNALTTGAHARAAVRYRALPRTGRRLSKRGAGGAGTEATLKCLTAHTFALCDGDRCTDMGAVAAGTACIDGAITWDTTSEASSEDSSAATVSYAVEVPSPSTAAAVEAPEPSSTEAAAAEETLSAAQPLANNVAVQTSSAADAAATASAVAVDSVQLHVGSSNNDDDDDWECDSDDVSSSSSSSTAWTPAASSSSTAVDDVQLNAKPTTTTTTTQAPAQTSAAASSGGDGTTYTGRGTYYYQGGAAGSCGNYASDSDYVVALSYTQVDNGSHCGQKVQLTNTQNGKTVVATVADTCPGCAYGAIDLSEGAFLQLGTLDQGVLPLSWKYVS